MSLRDTSSTTPSTAYALQEMATREEYQPIKEKPRIPIVGEDDQDSEGGCCNGFCAYVLIIVSVILVIMFFPFSLFFLIKIVPEYERAVIFRLGRLMDREAKGPGTFFILPCIDKYVTVDLRTKSFDVPPQNVLTKDSVTIFVDAVVYYKIFDPIIASTNIRDAGWATRLLSQTMLRNVLGAHSLSETMTNRDLLATTLQTSLDEATDPWGVKVERVEIKDVRLPQQLQRAMAAEAEASREARAKVIAAEGEMNAARALKEAAEVISRSPTALQLRYLQTLSFIAGERGSTIMFPIPLDMLGGMAQNWTPPVGVPFVGQPPPSMPLDPNNP